MADDMIFPPGVPEEFQEKVREMVDRQKMASQVTRQSISRFFQEMNQDQLEVFKLLMNNAAANPVAAGFYEGMASGLLAQKFDKWPGWDDDEGTTISFEVDGAGIEFSADGFIPPLHPSMTAPGDDEDEQIDREANMHLYNVEGNPDDPTDPRVRCKNCQMIYVSLEDRMLRPADAGGCSGCIEKAKWGGNS